MVEFNVLFQPRQPVHNNFVPLATKTLLDIGDSIIIVIPVPA